MSETNAAASGRRLQVWAIPESRDGEKTFWVKIGVAFTNRDGSVNVVLDALPLGTNRLQIREQKEEARPGAASARRNGSDAGKKALPAGERVDLNRASVTELMRLPGVGEKRAQAIVAHRTKQPFRRAEDVLAVKGLGPAWFAKVKGNLQVGGAAAAPPAAAAARR
jgi:competence protein ComEA